MNYYSSGALVSFLVFGLGLLALFWGVSAYRLNSGSHSGKRMCAICVCVFLWDFGYAWMGLCYGDQTAYIARAIGLAAIHAYMIGIVIYVAFLAQFPKKILTVFEVFYIPVCVVCWYMIAGKDSVEFVETPYGYYFKSHFSIARLGQFLSIFAALLMFYVVLLYWYKKTEYRRYRQLIKRFSWIGVILSAGYLLDTLIPMIFHTPAVPGSVIGAFFASFLIYRISRKYIAFAASINSIAGYIFSKVETPILIMDTDGSVMLFNDKAAEYFQVSREAMRGKKKEELFDVLYNGEAAEDVAGMVKLEEEENLYMVRGREVCCKLAMTEARDEFGDLLYSVVFVQDMTSEQKVMRLMRESREAAEAANQAKSNFLANMSHEIRTPMNAIIGMSDIMLQNEDLSEDLKNQVLDIKGAGTSLLGIINDVLDISKIEAGKYELVNNLYDLPSMLHDVSNIIGVRLLETPVEFKLFINPTIPHSLVGDVLRIRQILLNIIGNAVKFTRTGSITMRVDWNGDQENTLLCFDVIDTGIGIKEEDLKDIFGIFNQVNTRKNRHIAGTGLGLAISKNLAELMGGDITVDSVYGEGSTFHITLRQKVTEYKQMGEQVANSLEEKRYLQSVREKQLVIEAFPDAKVLIVDDNRVNLVVAKGVMKPYQMQIDTASSGKDAIELVKANDYDIIFMDHMMPELDGIDTTHLIRELDDGKYMDLPIIALTANAVGEAREMFISEGLQDFLAKPIDKKELDAVIHRWLK